jgi:hypothetical protein
VVKNCGQTVHDEVASKQTMEELKDLIKVNLALVSVMSAINILSSTRGIISLFDSLLEKYCSLH